MGRRETLLPSFNPLPPVNVGQSGRLLWTTEDKVHAYKHLIQTQLYS